MRTPFSTPEAQAIAQAERQTLASVASELESLGAAADARQTLADALAQLDELFLLVIVGEFNSGKSAFINALLGEAVLEEGVTPTTARVHVLQYGPERSVTTRSASLDVLTAPIPLLTDLHLVDTPGTNAVAREHEVITLEFVPRADLVLFITSADRPFTESERQFLSTILDWGKKIVVVLNKVDLFERDAELDAVMAFVRQQARDLLGHVPEVFPVSARQAFRAKHGDPALWASSRFEPLERFIAETLDQRARLRIKLSSPLGVAQTLVSRYLDVTTSRVNLLVGDVQLLGDIDRQLATGRADMDARFEERMAGVDNVLLRLDQRGQQYFDEMLRLGRVFDLLNRGRVQSGFEQQVVGDTPAQIERAVGEIIDWLVNADLRQWQAVAARVGERMREHRDRIVGDPEIAVTTVDRARLADAVGLEAQRVVDGFDRHREAAALAESARTAVATTAAVGAGAVGLGAAVAALATTAAADVTGLLMAGVVGTVGLLVIPARRRRAKKEFRDRIATMRASLGRALREQFRLEMQRSTERVEATVAPYSRFVRSERERLTAAAERLRALADQLEALRGRIDRL